MIFLSVFSSTGDRDKALPRPRLHCTTLSAVMQNLKNTQLRFYRKEILTTKKYVSKKLNWQQNSIKWTYQTVDWKYYRYNYSIVNESNAMNYIKLYVRCLKKKAKKYNDSNPNCLKCDIHLLKQI